MKINSSSLHQIIHDAPNKTVFTNKISHKPILIVLPKRDYISIVQDERMNHGNWDYIYKALRVVCDAKPLLNLTNHEKIRKVDTKCTFLFRNYYFSRTEYLLIPSKPWIMKHLEMVTRLAVTVACALFQSQSAIYCLKSSKRKKYFHTLSLAEDWFSYRRQSVDDKLLWEGSIPAVSLIPSKQNIEPAGSAHLAVRVNH